MATKTKAAAKSSSRRTTTKKKVTHVTRIKRALTGGFEAKKLILIASGVVLVIVLGFTGYALIQKATADASTAVLPGTQNLGTDVYGDAETNSGNYSNTRFYVCRAGSSALGSIQTLNMTDNLGSVRGSVAWMSSSNVDYAFKNVKKSATSSWQTNKTGKVINVTLSGLNATAVIRVRAQMDGGAFGVDYQASQKIEFKNIRVCQ